MKPTHQFVLAAIVAGSLFATGVAVQAQDTSATNTPAATPTPKAHGGAAAMMKQLDLTDDQKPKVKAILSDMQQKMKDLREDTSLSPTDRRAKMKDIRDDANTQLKAILTDDQYAKWQKISAGHHRAKATPPSDTTSTNAPAAN